MKPYKVSEVNNYINKVLSTDFILSDIRVEGEVSNFIHHNSGHMYFSLKDKDSKLKAIMFKWDNEDLGLNLDNGKKVIARGNISVYEREGTYQLYVKELEESGIGELYKDFEKLKLKLEEEGLFSDDLKKAIPILPKKIGVVTSATGAAVKDIINIVKRRFPPVEILIYPVLVQGEQAPEEIIKGLLYLDKLSDIDLIIFGRGGGSTEELFAFNDEKLARVISNLKKPSISAVGHEIDFTISDFVSDLRAPTPSAAAELAVPDIKTYKKNLYSIYLDIKSNMIKRLDNLIDSTSNYKREIEYYNPKKQLLIKSQFKDQIYKNIVDKLKYDLKNKQYELDLLKNAIDMKNPMIANEKGFALILDRDKNIIKSIGEVRVGEEIEIILKDGRINANIINTLRGDK